MMKCEEKCPPSRKNSITTVSSDEQDDETFELSLVDDDVKEHEFFHTFESISSILHVLIMEGESLRGEGHKNVPQYDIFNRNDIFAPVPSKEDVLAFVGRVCVDSQMEYECIVVSLVYLRKLLKGLNKRFVLLGDNWEFVFLACCVLSNKMNDDFHMTNADYCVFVCDLTLERLNKLELSLLNAFQYHCNVSPRAYSRCLSKIHSWNSPRSSIDDVKVHDVKYKEAEASTGEAAVRLPDLLNTSAQPVDGIVRAMGTIKLPSIEVTREKKVASDGKMIYK